MTSFSKSSKSGRESINTTNCTDKNLAIRGVEARVGNLNEKKLKYISILLIYQIHFIGNALVN